MSKKLIVDYLPFEVNKQQINESIEENNGRLVVKGVLQRAEAENQNGRIYPRDILMREAEEKKEISVNLEKQIIVYQNDKTLDFEIDKFRKKCLIEGLDDIGLTLQKNKKIDIHEEKIHSIQPWIV